MIIEIKIIRKMRPIFKQLISLFIVILLLGVTFGCSEDILNIPPVDAVTQESFYKNTDQMQRALNAAYSTLGNRGMYGWWLPVIRMVRTDDCETVEANVIAHSNFTETDTDIRLFNRNNGDGLWNSLYFGILRSNLIIAKIDASNVPNETTRNAIKGQALFLRALYYFHVVNFWNKGALLLEDNFDAIDVPLASKEEIINLIEKDLLSITNDKLVPWSYSGAIGFEKGRATLGAAYSLLGKLYLYENRFSAADEALQMVINNGGYGLLPVNQIFTVAGENGVESVFEVQFNNTNAGINPFFDDGVQAAETTLRNQTIAPNQFNGWSNAWPSQDLVNVFESGDLRRKEFIVGIGEFYPTVSNAFRGRPSNKSDFAVRKGLNSGWTTGTPNGTGEENFPIIRYADVLLMLAEAKIRNSSANQMQAIDLIDQVRARAFGVNVTNLRAAGNGVENFARTKNISLFEALKLERRKELCFEGHRYLDLVRWGDAVNNSILVDRGYSTAKTYYPLSREDVDLSTLFGN